MLSLENLINWLHLGNILIAGSINSGDVLREITAECGFEVDEEGAAVIDHLNYDVLDQGKVINDFFNDFFYKQVINLICF